MRRPKWGSRYALVALALAAAPLVAQAPARPVTFWFNAGYGVGWSKGYSSQADAFSLSGSVQWRWLLVSGRAAGVSSSIFDSVWDLGLLAGIASRPRRSWHVGLAAGLGAMEAQDGTRTLGVPLEAQLFLRFPKIVGVGLYGFANLNDESNFGGVTLALQLGRLR